MVKFKGHEIYEDKNGLVEVILHVDTSIQALEEFSTELGNKSNENLELSKAAYSYVKKHLPKVKFKQIKVVVAGLVVATMLGTVLTVPGSNRAMAADTGVGISAGSLAVDSIVVGSFTAVILEGRTQSTFADLNTFNVSDATGSGNGWNVVIKATPFSTGGTNPLTLPEGSLTIGAPGVAKADPGSSDLTTISGFSGAIDTTEGLKLLSAARDGGMGTYTVSFPEDTLKLSLLPKDVKAGTYTSTISVTINSGP